MVRTGSRFTTEVVSLIGTKLFAKNGTPSVTASILPIEEVAELINPSNKDYPIQSWGEINNNTQIFENRENSCAKFQNLQLKNITRNKTKENVSDNLFALIFCTNFKIYGLEFNLWTASLPLAVISHESQRMKSNATVIWNNAGGHPFKTQKELPWNKVNIIVIFDIIIFVTYRNRFLSSRGTN